MDNKQQVNMLVKRITNIKDKFEAYCNNTNCRDCKYVKCNDCENYYLADELINNKEDIIVITQEKYVDFQFAMNYYLANQECSNFLNILNDAQVACEAKKEAANHWLTTTLKLIDDLKRSDAQGQFIVESDSLERELIEFAKNEYGIGKSE